LISTQSINYNDGAHGGLLMLRRIRTIVVSVLLFAVVVYLAAAPTASPIQPESNRSKERLGFLEHRGKRYWISDLMNPAYRAASDDPFIKQFDQGVMFADIREDVLRRSETTSLRSKARETHLLPWAGRNMADIGE